MIEESKPTEQPAPAAAGAPAGSSSSVPPSDSDAALQAEPLLADLLSIEEFAKVDLRVARVLEAATLDGSRKLLRLRVSLGSEERTIFAGIRSAYTPESLIGRLIVVVANLAPRQMKVGTSEGMALAAGDGAPEVFLLAPDAGASPGQRIH